LFFRYCGLLFSTSLASCIGAGIRDESKNGREHEALLKDAEFQTVTTELPKERRGTIAQGTAKDEFQAWLTSANEGASLLFSKLVCAASAIVEMQWTHSPK
jgi:hypothetical protein